MPQGVLTISLCALPELKLPADFYCCEAQDLHEEGIDTLRVDPSRDHCVVDVCSSNERECS
jgi:hypothetical protein